MRIVVCAVGLLIIGCGSDNGVSDMGADLSVPLDLRMPDLTPPPDFAGIACGNSVCIGGNQECCGNFANGMLTAMCTPVGSCDGGAPILCDGPEDCPGDAPPTGGCCADVNGTAGDADAGTMTMGSGDSACGGNCPASAGQNGSTFFAHTKLCHTPTDCAGYVGDVAVSVNPVHNIKFDGCCSSPTTGPYRFCAPKTFANYANLTCM